MSLTEQPKISNELIREGMRSYHFSVIIEKDQDGYFAFCPELQGCYTQGDDYEEVLRNIRGAIRLHVEDRLEAAKRFLSLNTSA